MQIEVTESVEQSKFIDVDLPLYLKKESTSDNGDMAFITLHKFDERGHFEVAKSSMTKEVYKSYRFNVIGAGLKNSGIEHYIKRCQPATAQEFEDLKNEVLLGLTSV